MEQDFESDHFSGSESGWTLYLGHSMYPYDPLQKSKNEEDDDMSMVSDASSGPPHVQEQECNRKEEEGVGFQRKIQDFPCFLHDTATSSFFNFYVGNGQVAVGEGDNFNEDYSEGESRFQDQLGHFSSSLSGTQLQ